MGRTGIKRLRDIPNIGPAIEQDLLILGMHEPADLAGQDPYALYERLCSITQSRHDPCLIDVFISAVRYMEGGPARKWWEFTAERKQHSGTRTGKTGRPSGQR